MTIFDRIGRGDYETGLRPGDAGYGADARRLDAAFMADILLHLGVPQSEHGDEFLTALVGDVFADTVTLDQDDYVREVELLLPLYRLHVRLLRAAAAPTSTETSPA